jgi:hypothetical protein
MALAALTAAPAEGQTDYRGGRLGLMGGATYSQLGGSVVSGTDYRWGFIAGAYGVYQWHPNLSIQLELNYAQKGGAGDVDDNGGTTRADVDIDYVEIPLILNAITHLNPNLDWNFYAGISLGFEVRCQVATGSSAKQSCDDTTLFSTVKSSEWAFPFGTSLVFDVGGSHLTLDGRYSLGLSQVAAFDLKNRSWQFMLRWAFPLSRGSR